MSRMRCSKLRYSALLLIAGGCAGPTVDHRPWHSGVLPGAEPVYEPSGARSKTSGWTAIVVNRYASATIEEIASVLTVAARAQDDRERFKPLESAFLEAIHADPTIDASKIARCRWASEQRCFVSTLIGSRSTLYEVRIESMRMEISYVTSSIA